jgi:hypothetical protein
MKLGQPIAESAPSYPGTEYETTSRRLITFGHESFSMGNLVNGFGTSTLVSSAWFAANCPVAYPWVVNEPTMVYQLGWQNGPSAGDNHDIGIYDTSWNRLVSTGSTAGVTNNALQFVDVTDTLIVPGYYYVVEAMDATTASRKSGFANGLTVAGSGLLALAGVMDSATTAFPLPDPLTNMAAAATVTRPDPIFIATRALV